MLKLVEGIGSNRASYLGPGRYSVAQGPKIGTLSPRLDYDATVDY